MKFVLASYGTRGDVEPYIAVGRELLHRGHEVRMAVPPDQVGFAESAGLAAVGYGPDARRWQQVHREFLARLPRGLRHPRELARCGREDWALINQFWTEAVTTMIGMCFSKGSDLMSLVAWTPSMTGIRTSIRMMSGLSKRARSMAS